MNMLFKHIAHILIVLVIVFALSSVGHAQNSKGNCKTITNKKAVKFFDDAVLKYRVYLYGHAVTLLKEAVKLEPDYYEAYFLLGLIYFDQKYLNLKSAKEYFLKTKDICNEYDVYVYYYLADIYFEEGDFLKAYENYSFFLEDVDKIRKDEDFQRASYLLEYSRFLHQQYANPVPFKPVFVKGISTNLDEYLPIISPDNEIALFTRKIQKASKQKPWEQIADYEEKFCISHRTGDGFSAGEVLPYPFNNEINEGGATLTIDNNELFYTVCKIVNLDSGNYFNCDIYYTEYKNDTWSPVKNLGDKINNVNTWESQPTISSDGSVLYFTSDRAGGLGGYDIYKSVKNADGSWSKAQNLGEIINTKGNEKSPFIHTDNETFYFASDGHKGLGGYDIFYAKIDSSGRWHTPKNIGYPINTVSDEVSMFVSTDGMTAYFASNKYEGAGGWDLYSFDLYEEARPEKVLFIKGQVNGDSSDVVRDALVTIKNMKTKEVREVKTDSISGKYVIATQFKNDYILSIKKDGFTQKSKYLSVEDTLLEKPTEIVMDVQKLELGKSYTIENIRFAYNSDELTSDSKLLLDEFALFLSENDNLKIAIAGHTDNTGNDKYNLELSHKRAKSVYSYLLSKSIHAKRLSYQGYGETKPIADNKTEAGRALNRRTEFVITDY